MNLLMATAIAHSCEVGQEWFDMNPSDGHAGTEAFKRGFGTTTLPCPKVVVTSAFPTVHRVFRFARRAVSSPRQAWNRRGSTQA